MRENRRAHYCDKCLTSVNATCSRCGGPRRKTGYYCKVCVRDLFMQWKYGISAAEYDRILAGQGDRCAICRRSHTGRAFHVDHDHDTGRIRGLLCGKCNSGLGQFDDSPGSLRRAADYLEQRA